MVSGSQAALEGTKDIKHYSLVGAKPVLKSPNSRVKGVLAQVQFTQPVSEDTKTKEGKPLQTLPRTLITKVCVKQHPMYTSVTKFEVSFKLKDNINGSQEVGTLHAQTIDRSSPQTKYKTELLNSDLDRPMDHSSGSDEDADEIQTIMRHIFHSNGAPREGYTRSRRPLGAANLHFIAEFEIFAWAHGPNLAQLAMSAYHEAVQALKGGFAFKGTVVLSPAALRSTFEAKGGLKSYVEVEHALIKSYRKSGYKVWSKADDSREGGGITIMGRTIGELDVRDEDREPEIEFPAFIASHEHMLVKEAMSMETSQEQEKITLAHRSKPVSRGGIRKETRVNRKTPSLLKRRVPTEYSDTIVVAMRTMGPLAVQPSSTNQRVVS